MDLFQFPIELKANQAAKAIEKELAKFTSDHIKLIDFLLWMVTQNECPPTFRAKCEELMREMQKCE